MAAITLEEFLAPFRAIKDPEPVTYRLYHNEEGCPLFYSMEQRPGTYIEIDAETFAKSPLHVRVKDGKLVEAKWQISSKLIPGDVGTPCYPGDVAIVVDTDDCVKWTRKTYEQY